MRRIVLLTVLLAGSAACGLATAAPPSVEVRRVPEGGLEPRVAVDAAGTVHLVYFKGKDPKSGDVFYVRSTDPGAT